MDTTTLLKFGKAALTSAIYCGGTYWLINRNVPDTYLDHNDCTWTMKNGWYVKVPKKKTTFGKTKNFEYFAAAGYLILLGGMYYIYNYKPPSNYS